MTALRVGLTGGIGSGKSTVAHMLAKLGAKVIDTDVIARTLTAPQGAAIPKIAAIFGADMLTPDGALNRQSMRSLAFSDPQAKHRLEAILHPLIQASALQQQADATDDQITVLDVPLLTERIINWSPYIDRVLVVECSPTLQISRVMRRSGWSEQDVQRVLAVQAKSAERKAIAHDVIDNNHESVSDLQRQVHDVWQTWQSLPVKP